MRTLIIGCGYVGLPLGAELVRLGHQVWGMRRGASGDARLRAAGIEPVQGDITRPEGLTNLVRGYDWVVNTVSSSKGGADEYRAVYLDGNRNLLAAFSESPPAKYIFTSSTSVYGQTDGSVVTERSPTEPVNQTSQILVEAEKLLLGAAVQRAFPAIIARVAGIYGPGRGYLFQQYLRGEASITAEGARYLNMIHLDDVVSGLIALLESGRPGEVYNLVDDEPVREREFFEWLSKELNKPMPQVATAQKPRKRGLTNKRVSNQKLKTELAYLRKFPTFREGYGPEIARFALGKN